MPGRGSSGSPGSRMSSANQTEVTGRAGAAEPSLSHRGHEVRWAVDDRRVGGLRHGCRDRIVSQGVAVSLDQGSVAMRVSILLTAVLLSGCTSSTGPDGGDLVREVREHPDGTVTELRIGAIEHYGDPVRVEVPESVQRNQDFTVKVTTYGGGCITKGTTEVKVEGRLALITPYDWVVTRLPPNWACTLDLRLLEHTATLRFSEPGTAQIQIRGRKAPSDETVTVKRSVQVR